MTKIMPMLSRRGFARLSVLLPFGLLACTKKPKDSIEIDDTNTTDQMFTTSKEAAEFFVFQFGGNTLTVDGCYPVVISYADDIREGSFYKVVADVDYLNGGIAGYVDFPEVKKVISYNEVSPFEIGLPPITESPYGLSLIGDYAEGDVFLNELDNMGVWKNGSWVYIYQRKLKLDDGTMVCALDGVTKEEVQQGIESGVLSCEKYFAILPN